MEQPATQNDQIEQHAAFAKIANNRCWELLALEHREPNQNFELIEAAYASQWHWRIAGTALHRQRSEWLISHCHAAAGHGGEALRHAQRCWEITQESSALMQDFDHAYACEALARAYRLLGQTANAERWYNEAVKMGTKISDDEDRKIFDGDLSSS